MARPRRFRVEKLIRDRLPEIMRASGLAVFERALDDGAFVASLKTKLLEEARETHAAAPHELLGELADVSEVLRALAEASGYTLDDVEAARLAKRAERGGFDERIYNEAVEAPDGHPALDYYIARPDAYPEIMR